MMSLRKRLGRGLTSVLCVIFVLHWIAADWVIRAVAEKQMANRLADDAYSLLDTLAGSDDDQVSFNGDHISTVYNRPLSGHYYLVKVDARPYPSPSLANFPLQVRPIGPEQIKIYHISGPDQRPLLVLGLGLVKFGHRINIHLAEDLSAVDHDITAIRIGYLGLTLLILICAIGLLGWDVKRSLRPVVSVGKEIEQVYGGRRQRIELEVPTEIKPMVREINHLLQLVVRRLQQSRTAIGNLAHALKPPMAILFRIAEEPLFNDHPDLRQLLQTQTESIHRCIERELKRARIAGDRRATTAFNPRQELIALKRTLRAIYAEKALDIQFTAPNGWVHFDREDMLEMLGNLLDNACKWAKHRIDVDIAFSDTLTIRVADDGPGCPETDAKTLTQRGLRLDESIKGHGLGLAIVLDIVDSYRGSLQIGRSELLGGFSVTLNLALHR
ncbi:sensor histidine kinase [Methylomonas methanica]|uniref:histidine kinase n=1 Tax=Methylomonas methanica (strain DSM 25384 / MC09) TaxID=857087 RepID=G0A0T4_METMM|nr:sensor histidine kinase [Methylomonas methanica]AEG00019.1 integral membrane sensor signal transduction histidine kinase [Methylomonas methanica MC09]